MPSMLSPAHASEVESSPAKSAASGAFAPENMADLRTIAPQRPSLIRRIVRRTRIVVKVAPASTGGKTVEVGRQNCTRRRAPCTPSLRVQLLVQTEQPAVALLAARRNVSAGYRHAARA